MFRISVLGPVEISRDGNPVPVPPGKTSELLVRLAPEAGQPLRSYRLIDDLWGADAVNTRRNTLQSKVVRSLGGRFSGRAFAWLGAVSAVMILLGVLSSLDLPGVDTLNFAGYVLWSVWLVWLAVALLRKSRTATSDSTTGQPWAEPQAALVQSGAAGATNISPLMPASNWPPNMSTTW